MADLLEIVMYVIPLPAKLSASLRWQLTDRPFTNQDGQREADFINIVVWGKIAELCGNSLAKEHRALVEGRLQLRSYDGKDGGKRYVTEVVANSVEFLERKGYTPGNGSANTAPPSPMDGFETADFGDEEIPF